MVANRCYTCWAPKVLSFQHAITCICVCEIIRTWRTCCAALSSSRQERLGWKGLSLGCVFVFLRYCLYNGVKLRMRSSVKMQMCMRAWILSLTWRIYLHTACPNKHCAWQNRWLSQKLVRLAGQISKHFKAYSIVYNWWKNQENLSMQLRDIIDFIILCHFPSAQLKSCS